MHSMSLRAALIVVVVSLIPRLAAAQQDVVVTLVVAGESPVYHTNLVEARERALQDAFVTAVGKVLGTFVTAESFTRNYVSIERSILTKARGYIKTYSILGETAGPDMVMLRVEVTVSKEPLEQDVDALGILLQAMGHPRVLVAVSGEAEDSAVGNLAVAERVIREILTNKGFHVIEATADSGAPGRVGSGRTLAREIAPIRELGRQYGAAVLVVGTGVAESITTSGLAGLVGCIVRLDATALWAETGREIATRSVVMNGVGPGRRAAFDNAFEKAGKQVALALIAAISSAWNAALLNGRDLTLDVTVADYASLQRFRKRLAKMFGVKSARQKRFGGHRGSIDVIFTGSPQTLADLLSMTTFPALQVRVIGFSSERLEVEIR